MFFSFIGIGHSNHLVGEKQTSTFQKLNMGLSDFALFVSGFVSGSMQGSGKLLETVNGRQSAFALVAEIAVRSWQQKDSITHATIGNGSVIRFVAICSTGHDGRFFLAS